MPVFGGAVTDHRHLRGAALHIEQTDASDEFTCRVTDEVIGVSGFPVFSALGGDALEGLAVVVLVAEARDRAFKVGPVFCFNLSFSHVGPVNRVQRHLRHDFRVAPPSHQLIDNFPLAHHTLYTTKIYAPHPYS